MSFYLKVLFAFIAIMLLAHAAPVFAQGGGGGPAGIPLIEYMFARVVCITVPLGYTALLVVLIIAGFKYLISAGEAKAVQAAHQTVTWGILGVLFLAIAWLILLLIQNFTGVEVTKFSVSSLPGVQGFTGSCWAEAPVAPNPTPAPITPEPVVVPNPEPPVAPTRPNQIAVVNPQSAMPTPKPGTATPISLPNFDNLLSCSNYPGNENLQICLITNVCDNEDSDFEVTGSLNDSRNTGFNLFYTANTLNYLRDLGLVLPEPREINIFAGTDTNIYGATVEFHDKYFRLLPNVLITYTNGETGTIYHINTPEGRHQAELATILHQQTFYQTETMRETFGRFPKGMPPPDYIELVLEARRAAEHVDPNQPYSYTILGISCPNADYYNLRAMSPLIYLYPKSKLSVVLKIDSPLISTEPNLSKNLWNVLASPDGTLTTIDGKKYRYIPYEFLRSDFKRPVNGSVIEGSKLEEYLRKDLWKKLGLTDSEINDYWQDTKPRVKPAPYYFISLIDRSEIDRVLPMEVNPKPDTILRNMTYILPLSSKPTQSISPLNASYLTAPKRNGFTVLENGVFTDGF